MRNTKKALAIALLLCLLTTYATALDFGYDEGIGSYIRRYQANIADGTQLNVNTLEHVTAGRTEERYVKYTPGSQVMPIVSYGSVLYGKSTISRIANIVEEQGADIVAGINGDFFFVDTGIPIGLVVTDGILRCSCSNQNAVGFFEDGSATIGKPKLSVNLQTETGYSLVIDYVNVDRRNYGVYLLTPDFSSNTRVSTEGTTIIINQLSGDLRIGGTVTGVVSQVIKGSEPLNLEPGTMALTATKENNLAEKLEGVASSQQVTVSVSAADPIWNEVTYAVGAGDIIVDDGKVTPGLVKGGAPRTSLGITSDGSVILYTVDGRQSGYSNGMALSTLAARMISLGCVKAVNLDGGGSTVMIAQYPGYSSTQTINRPSEGTQRLGSNYIFLVNKAESDGTPTNLHIYPYNPIVLSGSTVLFETRASDGGYYPVNVPIGIRYSVSNTLGSVSQDGKFLAGNTEGRVDVYVSLGNLHGETSVTVIKTPTTISVADSATGKTVQSLDVSPEEIIEFVASASFKGVAVHADNSAFKWEIVNSAGNIGSIDQNGVFTSSNMPGSRGKIRVSAGELSVELPVIIGATDQTIDSFEDPGSTGLTSGDNLIGSGIEKNKGFVRYGNSSGRITYDFSGAEDQMVTLPTRWSVPRNSRYLHLWLYGDNSGNKLSFNTISRNGKAMSLPVATLDFTGYKHIVIELTEDLAEISAVNIWKETDTILGTIYFDQMVVSYSSEPKSVGPAIEILRAESSTPGYINIVARITENQLPVPKNRISMTLDGKPVSFNHSEVSSELSVQLAIPDDGTIHRATIVAWDSFGNISTSPIDIEPASFSQSIFVDTVGHWSEKYAAYLNRQGVINGVIKDDGTYFYPSKKMTRAEFAVMLTNYLGLDATDYTEVELPYVDIDTIPAWAMNSVAAMYVNNVFQGKSINGTLVFDPNSSITRAQVMTALGRTLPKGMDVAPIAFFDSKDIPDYAAEYVGVLIKAKVLTGYSDGTIRPNADVQRGEAIKMLYGLY